MIAALLVFGIIVLFHEFGHFLFAKLNGIGVIEFSLGFGPRLLSWKSKKSGTRYSWKLIPFGGSCAMYGEFDDEEYKLGEEEDEEEDEKLSSGIMGYGPEMRKISEEEQIRAEFADGKHGASFFKKSPLARISVVAAGPIFNFLLALVFSIVIVSWAGYDYPQIVEVLEGNAADVAGIQVGDVITKIGNRDVIITRDLLLYMTVNDNQDLPVQYKRMNEDTGKWEYFESVLDSDYYYYNEGRYLSGMNFSGYRSAIDSVGSLFKYSAAEVRYTIFAVMAGLKEFVAGQVQTDDIAGPVRIVTLIDDTVEQVSPYGAVVVIMNVLNLVIMLSANLGVMNLLPIPALDGGRLVFLFVEAIRGKALDPEKEGMVHMIGIILLFGLMFFVMFNDIRKLFV